MVALLKTHLFYLFTLVSLRIFPYFDMLYSIHLNICVKVSSLNHEYDYQINVYQLP